MITRTELLNYLNKLMTPDRYRDYAPNGLQVEGKSEIKTIITGVTACQALIDKAIEKQADAILVHHGYFWKGENPCVVGMKRQRLKSLLKHNINLFAYHLPLDGLANLGNNAQLAQLLGFKVTGDVFTGERPSLVLKGELELPQKVAVFDAFLKQQLESNVMHIEGAAQEIKTVAWCTGGAQDYIEHAANAGVDAYISGEISERTVHAARELGIHYFACGHHATERYGVKALGECLQAELDVQCEFVDVPNPV